MRRKRLIAILLSAVAGFVVMALLLFLMSTLISGMGDKSHTSVNMPALVSLPTCPAQKKMEFEIATQIRDAQACETDEDCELLTLGCPFGCDVPVNKGNREQIFLAASAYSQYVEANECERCQNECRDHASPGVVCENKVCKRADSAVGGGG